MFHGCVHSREITISMPELVWRTFFAPHQDTLVELIGYHSFRLVSDWDADLSVHISVTRSTNARWVGQMDLAAFAPVSLASHASRDDIPWISPPRSPCPIGRAQRHLGSRVFGTRPTVIPANGLVTDQFMTTQGVAGVLPRVLGARNPQLREVADPGSPAVLPLWLRQRPVLASHQLGQRLHDWACACVSESQWMSERPTPPPPATSATVLSFPAA